MRHLSVYWVIFYLEFLISFDLIFEKKKKKLAPFSWPFQSWNAAWMSHWRSLSTRNKPAVATLLTLLLSDSRASKNKQHDSNPPKVSGGGGDEALYAASFPFKGHAYSQCARPADVILHSRTRLDWFLSTSLFSLPSCSLGSFERAAGKKYLSCLCKSGPCLDIIRRHLAFLFLPFGKRKYYFQREIYRSVRHEILCGS